MKRAHRSGRSGILVTLLTAALLGVAGAALAVGENGTGVLDDVDAEAGTLTVNDRVYTLSSRSEFYDAYGRPIALHILDEHLGDWVLYKSSVGRAVRLLEVLQIAPDDD